MKRIGLVVGLTGALVGCERSPKLFEGAPFPTMIALSCELKSVHVGALNPAYAREHAGDTMTLTITNLDPHSGTAQLIGNAGAANVKFVPARERLEFIERTASGGTNLLDVFAPPDAEGPLAAVFSRHILISPANVAISQYAGSCMAKDGR